jgi:hypothetical protein
MCTTTSIALAVVVHEPGQQGVPHCSAHLLVQPTGCEVSLPQACVRAISAGGVMSLAVSTAPGVDGGAVITLCVAAPPGPPLPVSPAHGVRFDGVAGAAMASFVAMGLQEGAHPSLCHIECSPEEVHRQWDVVCSVGGGRQLLLCARGDGEQHVALFEADVRSLVLRGGGTCALLEGCQAEHKAGVAGGSGQHVSSPLEAAVTAAHADIDGAVVVTAAAPPDGGAATLTFWKLLEGVSSVRAEVLNVHLLEGPASAVHVLNFGGCNCAVAAAIPSEVVLFVQSSSQWVRASSCGVPAPPHSLSASRGLLYVGMRSQVISLVATLQSTDGTMPLGPLVAVSKAPLPFWHPHLLASFLVRGAHDGVLAILREVLAVANGTQSTPRVDKLQSALAATLPDAFTLIAALAEARRAVTAAVCAQPAAPVGGGGFTDPGVGKVSSVVPEGAGATGAMCVGSASKAWLGAAPADGVQTAGSQDAVTTGLVDMAMFGMAGMPVLPQASLAVASAQETGQVDKAAVGEGTPALPPVAVQKRSVLETGRLDMAAFSFGTQSTGAVASVSKGSSASTGASPSRKMPGPVGEGQPAPAPEPGADAARSTHRWPLDSAVTSSTNSPCSRCSSIAVDALRGGIQDAAEACPGSAEDRAGRGSGGLGCSPWLRGQHAVAEAAEGTPPATLRVPAPLHFLAVKHAAAAVLADQDSRERHLCSAEDALSVRDLEVLCKALTQHTAADIAGGAGHPRHEALGLQPQEAQLLLALASAFCTRAEVSRCGQGGVDLEALATQVVAFDAPGRRMLSAVRLGVVLLTFDWADCLGAPAVVVSGEEPPRRPLAMSASQSQLLLRLRRGSASAPSMLAPAARTPSSSLMDNHSGNLSSVATDTSGSVTSPCPFVAPPPHWTNLALLPTLAHAGLLWAFDTSSPAALLAALMAQMPAREPSVCDSSQPVGATSTSFAGGGGVGANTWTWANFRRVGAALWLQNGKDVVHAVDRMAKATFAAQKDALAVAHWYCAQGKLGVVGGLLRIGGDPRVAAFFSRDFSQPAARAAAAKNAHKLLSQHRYLLAAAFFLCARDIDAALDTCLYQLHDAHLAITLCRVLDASPNAPLPSPQGVAGQHRPSTTARLLARLLADPELPAGGMTACLLRRATQAAAPVNTELLDCLVSSPHGARGGGDSASKAMAAAILPAQADAWVLHTALQNARSASGGRVEHAPAVATDGHTLVDRLSTLAARTAATLVDQGLHAAAHPSAVLVSACVHACNGDTPTTASRACKHLAYVVANTALLLCTPQALRLRLCAADPVPSAHRQHRAYEAAAECLRRAGVALEVAGCQSLCSALLSMLCVAPEQLVALQSAGLMPSLQEVNGEVAAVLRSVEAPRQGGNGVATGGNIVATGGTPACAPIVATGGGVARARPGGEGVTGAGLLLAEAARVVMHVGERDAQV